MPSWHLGSPSSATPASSSTSTSSPPSRRGRSWRSYRRHCCCCCCCWRHSRSRWSRSRQQRICSTGQCGPRQSPHCLQGLVAREQVVSLQQPREDHLRTLVALEGQTECRFGIDFLEKRIRVRTSLRLNAAVVAEDLKFLVMALKKKFSLSSRPRRVR